MGGRDTSEQHRVGRRAPFRLRTRRRGTTKVRGRRSLYVGVAMVCAVLVLSLVVPLLSSYSPESFVAVPYQAPSSGHWFGTDMYGRDVFVRTFAAGRVDLLMAAVGVGFSLIVGTAVGVAVGAQHSRWVDAIVMRVVDAVIAVPFVVLVLALVVVIGPARQLWILPAGLPAVLVAVFVAGWTIYARFARAQTLALRDRDYVHAAYLLGYSRFRVMRRHLLPNVFGVTVTYAASDAILMIILIASLAFLGAGVQPPAPEWGNMMFEGRLSLGFAWWVWAAPGAILVVTALGLALISDVVAGSADRSRR